MKIFFSLIVVLLLSSCAIDNIKTEENKATEENKVTKSESYVDTRDALDLSNMGLTDLPDYVLARTNLKTLDISNNILEGALPAEIKNLQKLKNLNVSNNNMTGVPAEIGQMINLEYLDLSDNNLTGLPHELGNLSNLKELDISGNNYSSFDLDIITKSLPPSTIVIR